MSVTSVFMLRARAAACAMAFVIAAHSASAQTPAPPAAAQAAPAAPPDSAAQQIRDELDRLRREFESVRDTYGARLQPPSRPGSRSCRGRRLLPPRRLPRPRRRQPPRCRRPLHRPRQRRPRRRQRPRLRPASRPLKLACRRAPPALAGRKGRCRSTATPRRSRRSSTPTSRSSATSSARPGRIAVEPVAGARDGRGGGVASRRSSIPTRAPTSSSPFSPEGRRSRRRVHHVHRRCRAACWRRSASCREQFGKVNTLHAHVLPWVDRAARHDQPAGRRGRACRLRHLGFEADAEPVVLPRGDRRGLSGQLRRCSSRTSAAT